MEKQGQEHEGWTKKNQQLAPQTRIQPTRRWWREQELAVLREQYPHKPTAEIAQGLGRSLSTVYQTAHKLGLHKTIEYLASPAASRLRRGDDIGAAYRFKKGQPAHNKGLRRPGWGPGRMKETQFKKGNVSKRWDPESYVVGTLRMNADGYVDMKVREGGRGWRAFHVELWEDVNGPVPRGYTVCFKDHDRLNLDLANFELVSRADLCRRNSIHNLPPAIKGAIHVLGQLKRRIREKQDRGLTQPPVRNARRSARQGEAVGH